MRTLNVGPHLRTILVIDDDLDVQDVVEGFFRPRGFTVLLRADATEALREIRGREIEPDVILTDLLMPKMSGLEFTREMKRLGFDIPIILISAEKSAETAVQVIEAGAYDFIVKPIHFAQLLVSVERALHFGKMNRENRTLKAEVRAVREGNVAGIIGRSPGLLRALDLAKRVSDSASSVFVHGESGTGKEVIARAIHSLGKRRKAKFVAINCSAIPETLLESELFGFAKGAFTGASDAKVGLFEEAEGGTLFLDEIGDLSLPLQAKLLRVLQERKIRRIGENKDRSIDVRVVSATHKDLLDEVGAKRFREDLFFRLNVIPIYIPPLRERSEDILPLAEHFLTKYTALNGSPVTGFSKAALERLMKHAWRGNVRELENKIERAVVLATGTILEPQDLFEEESPRSSVTSEWAAGTSSALPLGDDGRLLKLEELTRAYVRFALERNGGAKDRTARDLGIDRKTLYKRIRDSSDVDV